MSTEAVDRRVRRTRKQLRECLVTLLKQKKVQDITVRELTELADLNRGTVYLHYMRIVLYKQNRTHFASSFPHGTVKRNTAPFSLLSAVISPPVDSIISRQI